MSDKKYYVGGDFDYEFLFWTDKGWASPGEDAKLITFFDHDEAKQCALAVLEVEGGHETNRRKPVSTDVNGAGDGAWIDDEVDYSEVKQARPEA
jgi:hypothetical protein